METTPAGNVVMTAPREVIDLSERFTRNREAYRSHEYNETETRREFIDPFLIASLLSGIVR